MSKPRPSSIANHFSDSKTVRCLKTGIQVDVTNNNTYEYNKDTNSYTSVGGVVTFWKDGEYAETINYITKKCRCENCDCNKSKTVKRDSR